MNTHMTDVTYDRDMIAEWKVNTPIPILSDFISFKPLPHRYKSNWRVLHIDGFEGGYGFKTIHFDFRMSAP